jgi:RHS repeat-associated protein
VGVVALAMVLLLWSCTAIRGWMGSDGDDEVEVPDVAYVYDPVGRLRAVSDGTGDTSVYSYDPAGNLVGVDTFPSERTSVVQVSPTTVAPGDELVVEGTGFAEDPGDNTVEVGGAEAKVRSATPFRLTAVVPEDASSGEVRVEAPGGAATGVEVQVHADRAPVVEDVSARVVDAGQQVTITGRNFSEDVLLNHVVIGGSTYAPIESASTTELVVSAPVTGAAGAVSVATPAGTGESDHELFVVPAGIGDEEVTADDVGAADVVEVGEPATLATDGADVVVAAFVAEAGRRIRADLQWQDDDGETDPCGFMWPTVVAPGGSRPVDTSWDGGDAAERLCGEDGAGVTLPATGTYLLVVDAGDYAQDGHGQHEPFDALDVTVDDAGPEEDTDTEVDAEDEEGGEGNSDVGDADAGGERPEDEAEGEEGSSTEPSIPDPEDLHPTSPPGDVTDGAEAFPVDLVTGMLVYEQTDLVVEDVAPIAVTRTHFPVADGVGRSNSTFEFGLGSPLEYSMELEVSSGNQFAYLTLPGGGQAIFQRLTEGTDEAGAVLEQRQNPALYGARVTWNGSGWDLVLPDGTTMAFTAGGQLQWRRDAGGNVLSLRYEEAEARGERVASVLSPSGRGVTFAYDEYDRIVEVRDHLGNTVSYTYAGETVDGDEPRWSDELLVEAVHSDGSRTGYDYDLDGRLVAVTGDDGQVELSLGYDEAGRVTSQALADGSTWGFSYVVDEESGLATQVDVTGPDGRVRRVDFAEGRWVRDTAALGTPEEATLTAERDPESMLVTELADTSGQRTTYEYDDDGYPTTVTDMAGTPAETSTGYGYDDAGNVTSTEGPAGEVGYGYDDAGNLVAEVDPLGVETGYDYAGSRLAQMTDPRGGGTLEYEASHRISALGPDGEVVRSEFYDAAGRLAVVTDEAGQQTRYVYDDKGRPVTTVTPDGGETAFAYDAAGNLASLTDANGNVTAYEYDEAGRLTARTDAGGARDAYEYDAAGRLAGETDRRGVITRYSYDTAGRAAAVTYGAYEGQPESTVAYSYDEAGRLAAVDDSAYGTVSFAYDELDRLVGETSPQGEVRYGYDDHGRRTGMTLPGGVEIAYGYDDLGRLTSITQGEDVEVVPSWDDLGRLEQLELPNGVTASYGYRDDGQLAGVDYGGDIGELQYLYDGTGRRTGIAGDLADAEPSAGMGQPAPGGDAGGPGSAGQPGDDEAEPAPSSEQSESSSGEPEPVAASAEYGAGNRLTGLGGAELTYDAAGNLVGDGTRTYTWNARGQLLAVDGPVPATFSYDPLGRRVAKTVDGATTSYLYDGPNVVQERVGEAGPITYVTGPGMDERYARVAGSEVTTYVTDVQGTVLGLAGEGGELTTSYTYDAFGDVTAHGEDDPNPYTFTGRELDETGLLYYRARYYDPAQARFLSEDPLEYQAGDPNLYAYVGNDPVNRTDPTGENPACLAAIFLNVGNLYIYDQMMEVMGDPSLTAEEEAIRLDELGYAMELNWSVLEMACLNLPFLPPVLRTGAGRGVSSFGRNALHYQQAYRQRLADNLIPRSPTPPARVIRGHGTYDPSNGYVVVPEGTTLTTYAPHGSRQHARLGEAINVGSEGAVPYRVYGPGEYVPNYTVAPPVGLYVTDDAATVSQNTPLSRLVEPGMGQCHLAFCLSEPGHPMYQYSMLPHGMYLPADRSRWTAQTQPMPWPQTPWDFSAW